MGQYYRAIFLKDKENENSKEQIEKAYKPHNFDNGAKLMESSWIGNNFDNFVETQLIGKPTRVVWEGDYADDEPDGSNLYGMSDDYVTTEGNNYTEGMLEGAYVVNHDKKEFYERPKYDEEKWTVNPLPILTCEGNGRGGGDYTDYENPLIGVWARDKIEIVFERPENYKEIFPSFTENY